MTDLHKRAALEAARLERKWGLKAGSTGNENFRLNVVPTGILSLDYALGIGGWPLGHPVEVFGPPDIGKSSVIGLSALRNAQAAGMLCGLIALEPGFDPSWAEKNGVDPAGVVVARPDDGEEAFEMLYEWVTGDIIDFIVFDSIGAVITKSELAQDEMKSKVGGQSKLITDGVKRILSPTWKNNKGVIFLNQVRDIMNSKLPGQVESPGGHALKHTCAVRVQLKTTGSPYKARVEGEDVVIGRTLVGIIKRNKMAEGSNKRAEFDFYQMETDEHPVGVDVGKDVINTALRTHVIVKAGAWYRHPSFPGDKNQFQGREPAEEYLLSNPQALTAVRQDVLAVMLQKQEEAKKTKPELEVVDAN